MFRYYLLVGDTAAPSGLYARLCHTFSSLGCIDNAPVLGVKSPPPKKNNYWGASRHFPAKCVKYSNFHHRRRSCAALC